MPKRFLHTIYLPKSSRRNVFVLKTTVVDFLIKIFKIKLFYKHKNLVRATDASTISIIDLKQTFTDLDLAIELIESDKILVIKKANLPFL